MVWLVCRCGLYKRKATAKGVGVGIGTGVPGSVGALSTRAFGWSQELAGSVLKAAQPVEGKTFAVV